MKKKKINKMSPCMKEKQSKTKKSHGNWVLMQLFLLTLFSVGGAYT